MRRDGPGGKGGPLHDIAESIYLRSMPFYDFRCPDCDARFERRLSMSAYEGGEGRDCPECGSTKVERAFTAVNVIAGARGGQGACCKASSGFT